MIRGNKDVRVVVILVVLIMVVLGLLVYFIRIPKEMEEESPIPTGSVTEGAPKPPSVTAGVGVQTQSTPTPTPLLSLGITPIIPEKDQDGKGDKEGGDNSESGDGAEVQGDTQDLLEGAVWSENGTLSLAELYAFADFVTRVYSEKMGIQFEGFPVTPEEYGFFDRPYAYYVDKYGYLHVNVRVVASGHEDQYVSGVVGYYGTELAVYELEVIKE